MELSVTQLYNIDNICVKSIFFPDPMVTGLLTYPASTHSISLYSSSPRSAIALAFSAHGFQTTKN